LFEEEKSMAFGKTAEQKVAEETQKLLSTGQQTVVSGDTIGIYLFRNTD
jgi:hypothetical protein